MIMMPSEDACIGTLLEDNHLPAADIMIFFSDNENGDNNFKPSSINFEENI